MPKKKPEPPPQALLTLPSRLKYARSRSGLTAAAIAARAGIDASQLSRYENAKRLDGVELATIIKLADALGVPVGWLAADEGGLPPVPVFRERDSTPKPDGSKS